MFTIFPEEQAALLQLLEDTVAVQQNTILAPLTTRLRDAVYTQIPRAQDLGSMGHTTPSPTPLAMQHAPTQAAAMQGGCPRHVEGAGREEFSRGESQGVRRLGWMFLVCWANIHNI